MVIALHETKVGSTSIQEICTHIKTIFGLITADSHHLGTGLTLSDYKSRDRNGPNGIDSMSLVAAAKSVCHPVASRGHTHEARMS